VRLAWLHARTATLELLRYRSFSLPTLLFPTVAFLVFGRRVDAPANVLMAYYAAFAVLGVAFYQFGVGIAAERVLPWSALVRVLPVSATVRFAARIMSALAFALASASLLVLVALATTSVNLDVRGWLRFGAVIGLGSVPFALFGIALGYWLSPKGALPTANLLFLGLAYAGGLLGGSAGLPDAIAGISGSLPTRLWGNLLGAAVEGRSWDPRDAVGLVAYAAVFAVAASVGYRRDEGERFR
jgi:ABC-2 type transport system permease protein